MEQVSKWMDNSDIMSFANRQQGLNVDRVKLLKDVAHGLEFLHHHDVIHGDIRPVCSREYLRVYVLTAGVGECFGDCSWNGLRN